MNEALIASLSAAVEAAPDDVPLRVHLAQLLVATGRPDARQQAIAHLGHVLSLQPGNAEALAVMTQAITPDQPVAADQPEPPPSVVSPAEGFDWSQAEAQVGDVVGPMFADGSTEDTHTPTAYDVEQVGLRLTDVGGLREVKERLEASFLAPLRNPELRTLYGKSLRGGLLLYGPPGCGKTFLAKAVAGELGAAFLTVSLADVLDMYIGQSERNLAELFETARASAPCVLFLDELDAIGQKRSMTRNSAMRTTVNQLLTELDGVGSDNEGVYVLAATNAPWDVDPALRRPGRLDRTVLVLPPDREAREAILRTHLRERPIERIDVAMLAKRTEGFSGADLAHLCETASEFALLDSVRTGKPRMITTADLVRGLADVRPSIRGWVETARNVALYANASGDYDDLAAFVRKYKG